MAAQVRQLRLWYFDKHDKKRKQIILEPEGTNILEMKIQIAKELRKLTSRNRVEYYYVVVAVEKDDGSPGYRTMVPKTVVA